MEQSELTTMGQLIFYTNWCINHWLIFYYLLFDFVLVNAFLVLPIWIRLDIFSCMKSKELLHVLFYVDTEEKAKGYEDR